MDVEAKSGVPTGMFDWLDGDPALFTIADGVGDRRIHVRGALDLVTAPQMATHLRNRIEATPSGAEVVLDLSGVDFLGSKGISALVAAAEDADARGCRLKVVGCRPIVLRVLDIAGVREMLSAVSAA